MENSNENKISESSTPIVKRLLRNQWVIMGLIALVIIGGTAGFVFLKISAGQVYTENAQISATSIVLAPETAGVLKNVFVQEGDHVLADAAVAQVGDQILKAQVDGIIVSINDAVGKIINPGETVVTMIDPNDLRVVGQVDEDKGLKDIKIGQPAVFTVDTFGSKQYQGVVDEISQVPAQQDIVFNISDQRTVKQFNVYVRFDISQYPELKNGMSAKLWVYKN